MKKTGRVLRRVLSIICFVLSFFFFVMFFITLIEPNMEGKGVAITLVIVFLVMGLLLWPRSKRSIDQKKKSDDLGILASGHGHHIEGLPIAEKTNCELFLTSDRLIIEGGGTTFNISISQIRALEVKTDTEIANIVHSSAAKGVIGGLIFGPIGLVVGSRAMSKEKRSYNYYLIINYTTTSGDISSVLFDAGSSSNAVSRIATHIKPMLQKNPNQTVNL